MEEQTSKSEGIITNIDNFELENQKKEKPIESSDSAQNNEIPRKKDELNIGLKTEIFDEKLTNEESSKIIDNQTTKTERRKSSRRSISDKKTTSYDNNHLGKDKIEKEKPSNEALVTDLEEQRRPLLVRRNTVVEEAEESLRQARKSIALENNRKNSVKDSWVELKKEIYNPQYREFMSRDCLAWFRLSLCYFIFYFLLASFFVMLLALYYTIKIDTKTPNLFYKESVMHYKGINPGLGFRPQVDVETELIKVNANESKNNFQSLDLFLAKYDQNKLKNFTGAHGRKQTYNYEDYIKGTPCSRENHFGFDSQAPCVIVKLNRIYGWLPTASAKAPGNLTKVNSTDKFVYIKCDGEQGADRDNIKIIDYYSPYPNKDIGGIPFKYFPFRNQPDYLSPLVFVHFKNISKNVLINVECRAYAHNIDNKDRLNRRGMTKFQLFIG